MTLWVQATLALTLIPLIGAGWRRRAHFRRATIAPLPAPPVIAPPPEPTPPNFGELFSQALWEHAAFKVSHHVKTWRSDQDRDAILHRMEILYRAASAAVPEDLAMRVKTAWRERECERGA